MRQIRFGILSLVLSVLLPAAASAQDVIGFSFGGGITMTRGDAAETHGSGINISAQTTVPLSQHLTVLATVGYQDLRLDHDGAALRSGRHVRCPDLGLRPEEQVSPCEPSTFRVGGGFVEGGDRRMLGVLLQGQLHLLPRGARLSPYVLAGAGVSQLRTTDMDLYFAGHWHTELGTSEVAPMADVGAGLQVRLTPAAALFAQGSYLTVFGGDTTTMVPLHLGLLIEMGP